MGSLRLIDFIFFMCINKMANIKYTIYITHVTHHDKIMIIYNFLFKSWSRIIFWTGNYYKKTNSWHPYTPRILCWLHWFSFFFVLLGSCCCLFQSINLEHGPLCFWLWLVARVYFSILVKEKWDIINLKIDRSHAWAFFFTYQPLLINK